MTWEHEVVVLEKNVRDLQKQLNEAHKRIAELSAQNRNKVVVLKTVERLAHSVREIVEQEIVGP